MSSFVNLILLDMCSSLHSMHYSLPYFFLFSPWKYNMQENKRKLLKSPVLVRSSLRSLRNLRSLQSFFLYSHYTVCFQCRPLLLALTTVADEKVCVMQKQKTGLLGTKGSIIRHYCIAPYHTISFL